MSAEQVYGYRACPDCGAAVRHTVLNAGEHVCSSKRYEDHQAMKARAGLDRLEQDLAAWLETPAGRFEVFYWRRVG